MDFEDTTHSPLDAHSKLFISVAEGPGMGGLGGRFLFFP